MDRKANTPMEIGPGQIERGQIERGQIGRRGAFRAGRLCLRTASLRGLAASLRGLAAFALGLAAFALGPVRADYRQKAEEQTAYLQTHFYVASARKYHGTFPVDPHGLPWAFMWANGVEWRVLVAAARHDPAVYRPVLAAFGDGLREYWDTQPHGSPPGFTAYCAEPGSDDKYYDDNAWLVLGFLDAYGATHDLRYLRWARQTQAFVLSGWDEQLGGGLYWSLAHRSKNTCSNAPAAVGALRLARLGDRGQEAQALRLLHWVNRTLTSGDGLYWDNIALDGTVVKKEWTYNTGLMIQADVLLAQTPGAEQTPAAKTALHDAERSADAAIAAWQDPVTGAFADQASFAHLLCEGLLQLYQADHRPRYLDAVRRYASFQYRHVRDPRGGGYWNDATQATQTTETPHAPKSLLENAAEARLFWLLAPYPDPDDPPRPSKTRSHATPSKSSEQVFRASLPNKSSEQVPRRGSRQARPGRIALPARRLRCLQSPLPRPALPVPATAG